MADQTTYLFIDGGYARSIHRKAMEDVFGVSEDPDPVRLSQVMRVFRVFFYDCLDDQQRQGETLIEMQARIKSQNSYFDEFRRINGVHVRLGTLRGKRARQKEVDILLAVDMMTHGFSKNMSHAVLLAGDLDFRPVVDALVRSGVFVQVLYEARSASPDLRDSADYGIELNWHALYIWSRESFKQANPVPTVTRGAPEYFSQPVEAGVIHQPGTGRSSPVQLIKSGNTWQILIENWDDQRLAINHRDQQALDRYVGKLYAPVNWTGRR